MAETTRAGELAGSAGPLATPLTDGSWASNPRAGEAVILGAPDATAPVLTNVSPAFGTTLATRSTAITFDVYDASPGLLAVIVWARFASSPDPVVIWDGSKFTSSFIGRSTRTGAGTAASPYHYSLREAGDWRAAIEQLWVTAIDTSGNMEGSLP